MSLTAGLCGLERRGASTTTCRAPCPRMFEDVGRKDGPSHDRWWDICHPPAPAAEGDSSLARITKAPQCHTISIASAVSLKPILWEAPTCVTQQYRGCLCWGLPIESSCLMPISALAPLFCHASFGGWLRYPDGTGTPGTQGREYHYGLYPCVATWRTWGPQPT